MEEIKRIKKAQEFIKTELIKVKTMIEDERKEQEDKSLADDEQMAIVDILDSMYWVIENLNFVVNGDLKREET